MLLLLYTLLVLFISASVLQPTTLFTKGVNGKAVGRYCQFVFLSLHRLDSICYDVHYLRETFIAPAFSHRRQLEFHCIFVSFRLAWFWSPIYGGRKVQTICSKQMGIDACGEKPSGCSGCIGAHHTENGSRPDLGVSYTERTTWTKTWPLEQLCTMCAPLAFSSPILVLFSPLASLSALSSFSLLYILRSLFLSTMLPHSSSWRVLFLQNESGIKGKILYIVYDRPRKKSNIPIHYFNSFSNLLNDGCGLGC